MSHITTTVTIPHGGCSAGSKTKSMKVSGSATWVGGVNHHRGYCVEKDGTRRRIISEDRPDI
jgi:hypothetical protein